MKFLIAGFGSIGRRHFRNLLSLGERDIIFYRTGKSTLPDDEIHGFITETNLDAALSHKPDAVIIANPTAYHLDVAIPAAEAGCHILLEKPISHSMYRVDEFAQAVQQKQVKVLVGFQFRYHPGLQKISQLLKQGVIGRPVSVRAHWGEYLPGWHPWEDFRQGYSARKDLGGGVVLTLCHPLDYLRWFLGDVSALWAFAGEQGILGIDVDEVAEIGLRFRSGVVGSVHLDYIQRPPTHKLEIIGSHGTIWWDYRDGGVHGLVAKQNQVSEQYFPIPDSFERNAMFEAQMKHFLAVLRDEVEPVCTLRDGIKALELALAVHQSAKERRMVEFGV